MDLITHTSNNQHMDNILEPDGNISIVDFLINQLLNLSPCCTTEADALPGAKSFADLCFTTQKIIGKYNILSSTKLLDPAIVDISQSDLQLLYEGYNSCSRPVSSESHFSHLQSSSSTSPIQPQPPVPTYSLSVLESPNTNVANTSTSILDIDSFLGIPTSLAVAKRGINVMLFLRL